MERLTNKKERLEYIWASNEHDKALAKIGHRKGGGVYIPEHTALMSVKGLGIVPTIIPAITASHDGFTNMGINSTNIDYRIAYNHKPFPFGHIYVHSGYICLGDLHVPPFVSEFDIMNPLETLFTFNDRNSNHGGARLTLSQKTHEKVIAFCKTHELGFEPKSLDYFANDTLWVIGYYLLEKKSKREAMALAKELFLMVFT